MEVKPGYKQTEVGVIPEEWECRRLLTEIREMTDFVAAGSFESLRNNVHVFDAPQFALYVRLFDLRLGLGHDAQKYVDEVSYKFLSKSNLFGNEILIANIGANVGEAFLMPTNMGAASIAPNMIVVRPNDQKVRFDFLYHYITSDFGQARMRELIAGSGHPKVNKTDLKKLRVLAPPLPEQRAIATALSDVDELLGGLDRLIAKKRDLKQAAMQQLLTSQTRLPGFHGEWEVKRLEDVADVKTGPFGSTLHESDYVREGTPIITVEHLGEFGVEHFNLPLVSDSDRQRLRAYSLEIGDIVFSRVGSVDRNALIRPAEAGWLFSGRLLRVRPDTHKVFAPFLSYQFHGETFITEVRNVAVGQTMACLNTQILKGIPVTLPSLPEQTAIASVLTEMDGELAALEQRREKTRALKQAMMQELLTGKTRLI